MRRVYGGDHRSGNRSATARGIVIVQTAQPREIGVLLFVVALLLVLFVVTLLFGSPVR
jgi:hypothetical protein